MNRAVRSKSGREIYGPKLISNNNAESSTSCRFESENGYEIVYSHSVSIESTETAPDSFEINVVDSPDATQIPEAGNDEGGIHHSVLQEMYRATVEDNYLGTALLLDEFPKLVSDEITEEGDRALHVAAAMKHQQIVQQLVIKMNPSDLALLDGHGYTACCYAAITGSVEIADLIIRNNPSLATAHDRENKTPLHKAALHGNAEMVSYLLKSAKVEDLSNDEWFDLLLVAIRRQMYDVALDMLESEQLLVTMRDNEGKALHLLARQPFFLNRKQRLNGVMREDMKLLAHKMWEEIEKLGLTNALELTKNFPILHDAAEVGNSELITMLTHTYPNLAWQTNNEGYTIFHIIVKHRHENMLWLIDEIGARKDLISILQDENGNNILHLAAELAAPKSRILLMAAFEMQREILWFERVKAIVPPLCLEMKNRDGQTPTELFSNRHKCLLEESRRWMRNATDSCMLVSALIFTIVFASAFAVPGAYNQVTGIPILLSTDWMTCFIIFEALSMLSSACSILCFLCIMVLGINEGHFARNLPYLFIWGLIALSFSLFGVVSVFMSAYFLVYVGKRAALVMTVIIVVYTLIVCAVCFQIYVLCISLPKYRFRKRTSQTLFKQTDDVLATNAVIQATHARNRIPRIPDVQLPLSASRTL